MTIFLFWLFIVCSLVFLVSAGAAALLIILGAVALAKLVWSYFTERP